MTAPGDPKVGPVSARATFVCVTCEAEIVGSPTFHVGLPFCCAGCVANGPCLCSYDAAADGGVPARALAEAADRAVAMAERAVAMAVGDGSVVDPMYRRTGILAGEPART
jgi:hypothetical protein